MNTFTDAQVRDIKKLAEYKGRKVHFRVFKPGMNINSYWDSGSRDYFYFINMRTMSVKPVPQNGTPFDRLNLTADSLDENTILVERVVYRGKDVCIYIHS